MVRRAHLTQTGRKEAPAGLRKPAKQNTAVLTASGVQEEKMGTRVMPAQLFPTEGKLKIKTQKKHTGKEDTEVRVHRSTCRYTQDIQVYAETQAYVVQNPTAAQVMADPENRKHDSASDLWWVDPACRITFPHTSVEHRAQGSS